MSTQHEEMLKRFDEKFNNVSKTVVTIETLEGFNEQKLASDDIKAFLMSEIDFAVANRDKEIVEEINKLGDLWVLEKTADETESGCQKFVRVNRDIKQKLLALNEE